MRLRFFLAIAIGVFVSTGLSVAAEKASSKEPRDPPHLIVEKREIKASAGSGVLIKTDKPVALKITGNSPAGSPSKGTLIIYTGEEPYKNKFKEVLFSVKNNETKLWEFAAGQRINSARVLVSSGRVQFRLEQPRFDIPESRVKKTTPEMAYQLNSAINLGAFDIARKMIAMGMDVNGQDEAGNSSLFMACMKGDVSFVKFLLQEGADPNLRNRADSTPIMVASRNRGSFAETVPLLIEHGADVKIKAKDGATVLWPLVTLLGRADEKRILETVKLVLSKGAEVDPAIEGGFTPLMFAVRGGHAGMTQLLIERGANVNARTQSGETPLGLALEKGDKEITTHLKSAGAR